MIQASLKPRIGPNDRGRLMTTEEFRLAEETEGYRYELARGVLEASEVPNDPHGQIVDNLQEALRAYRRDHPGVLRRIGGGGEFRVWIPEMNIGRNPDVAVVFHETIPDDRGRRPPRFVAEIVSPESRDRDYQTKRQDYWLFGADEYWIIDPRDRHVVVLSRPANGDRPHQDEAAWIERVFRDDERIDSLLLPDFPATVAELWINAE